MTTRQQFRLGLAACCLLVMWLATAPAQAYIDPSIGSYALQIIIASVVATLFGVKMVFHRVFGFFTRQKDAAPKAEPGDD